MTTCSQREREREREREKSYLGLPFLATQKAASKASYLEFGGMAGNVFYFTLVSPQLKQLFKNRILKEQIKRESVTYHYNCYIMHSVGFRRLIELQGT